MHINQFENSISKTFVTRGKKYFRDGHVEGLAQISPTAWRAEVAGTDDYFVFVELVDGRVVTSVCDCPFDGMYCKHEVAVYYAIREALENSQKFTLPEAVRTQSKEALLTVLEQMVNDFPALETYFGVKKSKAKSKVMTVQDAEKIIYRKLHRYSDYNGYIDEDAGELPFEGFYEVLEYAQNVVEKYPVEAVTLILYCREEADSLYERCEEWLFDELLSQFDEASYAVIDSIDTESAAIDVTSYLFKELRRVSVSGDDESMILNILIELSPLAQSRETIEGMLQKLSLNEYEKENYMFQLIMEVGTDAEIASYYTKEPLSAGLRTQIIDAAMDRENIEAALTLCANGIDAHDVPEHYKNLWLRKAFHLHGKQGNIGAQRFIAFELAVKGDADDFTRLKSLYAGDAELWADVLEDYLQTLEEKPLPWHYAGVLVEEEQWTRLSGHLQEKAQRLNTRVQYRELAMELLGYANSGYHEHALELKGILMAAYAKKRAFMEELSIIN